MGMTWWETIVAPTREEMEAKRRINNVPCNFIPQSQGCYQGGNHQNRMPLSKTNQDTLEDYVARPPRS